MGLQPRRARRQRQRRACRVGARRWRARPQRRPFPRGPSAHDKTNKLSPVPHYPSVTLLSSLLVSVGVMSPKPGGSLLLVIKDSLLASGCWRGGACEGRAEGGSRNLLGRAHLGASDAGNPAGAPFPPSSS
jgi:hypothetical protein